MKDFVESNREFFRTYLPKNKIRFITATALFDGHDASINIMRRLIQARGGEVIHLGHSRSAQEIAQAAIQEDVQAVALSSYQGGHVEFFSYVRELLDEAGAKDVKIFGGGGGVITPDEIKTLQKKGVTKIYSPEDGQRMGLDGIIGHIVYESDFSFTKVDGTKERQLARELTLIEGGIVVVDGKKMTEKKAPILGLTGTGGAGKSSLLDEVLLRFLYDFHDIRIGVVCIDPTKRKTGGALLGDRIRINACSHPNIFLRSVASRESSNEVSKVTADLVARLQQEGFDLIVVETSGIGQSSSHIVSLSDLSLYVMTPEYGASTQLEKIDMLDFADLIAINKFERRQGPDALRDVQNLLRRNRFQGQAQKYYPVYGTVASRFNDDGVNGFYKDLVGLLKRKSVFFDRPLEAKRTYSQASTKRKALIPPERENYLSQIVQTVRSYKKRSREQVSLVEKIHGLTLARDELKNDPKLSEVLASRIESLQLGVDLVLQQQLNGWSEIRTRYAAKEFVYQVRGKSVTVQSSFQTLSLSSLPKVALPDTLNPGLIAKYVLFENLPGYFPFTCGLFNYRRSEEDPKRQFAGEGGPLRTNTRFHFLSKNDDAKRLSTAFDSVTLYGSDPGKRPDIYGKVGESGVSIAHLDDMKLLYQGFDLCHPKTSVSMTINGPAPMLLAMFLNTAIDQQISVASKDRVLSEDEKSQIAQKTLSTVRGTVQADILKEDQAQNTCIFSIEFALKMMGDIQEYFIQNKVANYYAVSVSGYHIAEAGANPITQLALTLANGFTYVEYYLSRGFKVDDFAPNLSFFFSNGIDAEYTVIGRVARRIWAVAMRDLYGANERSQKLKYHVQTSGRSLHAQEMDFNDIRTTLQALMALTDNCNSLHTNAFDEALTTPTEASVRRAMAIQMIITKELGMGKSENLNQGSYFIEALTEAVEEAVLDEFMRISERGGVLNAMETQYQRSKIQEESLYYEQLKNSGEFPIIGVNTYLNPNSGEEARMGVSLIRANYEEKDNQITRLKKFRESAKQQSYEAMQKLEACVLSDGNIFAELMNTVRFCSLGEISEALYVLGGRYRRAM